MQRMFNQMTKSDMGYGHTARLALTDGSVGIRLAAALPQTIATGLVLWRLHWP